ncbi:MAG: DNA-binding response regulator [Verrucomicrobia bacterium]|nr:MAG: DNA-binding response regulator [Verrucomicrobiota bacterium]
MHLLLIEDSPRLQASLGRGLRKAGYVVDIASDGNEGLWLAQSNRYDVIILDLMLPGLDGLSLLRRLRTEQNGTHVLILTARDTVENRVAGLQTGADDYLIKPFAFEELLARVQALCRRSYQRKSPRINIGDLEIDTVARIVRRKGKPIELTAREFMLLEYLAFRRGHVVSRTEIETHIYSDTAEVMSNVIGKAQGDEFNSASPHGRACGFVLHSLVWRQCDRISRDAKWLGPGIRSRSRHRHGFSG